MRFTNSTGLGERPASATSERASNGPVTDAPQVGLAETGHAARTADRPRVKRRVLILCGDADGNLGDWAILQATCETLREAAPELALQLVVPCADPARARRVFGAAALPRGWRAWPGLWQAARASDLVICGGGGLFQDDDSLVKMPYWAARVALARRGCSRVAGLSLGVGPLKAGISRAAGRVALRRLDPVSVRDPVARGLASELAGRPVSLVPDPALLLKPASQAQAEAVLAVAGVPLAGRPLIGVAPRRWFPPQARIVPHQLAWRWRGVSERALAGNRRLAGLLAEVLDQLIERTGGHVVFLPSYNCPHEADDAVCELIGRQMRSADHTLVRVETPAMYKAVTARLSVMVGGRMHPTLLAASAGTPVVGLAYNPKFHGLFDLLGLEGQALDVVEFVEQRRVTQLVEMAARAMGGAPELAERATELGQQTRTFLHALVRMIQ